VYYTMSKETETQPYRLFKDFLDTIIKMPEDLKNRLANEFERRRIEKLNAPKQEETPESSIFGTTPEEENKSSSIFGTTPEEENKSSSIFGTTPEEENKSSSIFGTTPEEKKMSGQNEDKSLFDSIFSNKQTDELLDKFSKPPSLKHNCQIRAW